MGPLLMRSMKCGWIHLLDYGVGARIIIRKKRKTEIAGEDTKCNNIFVHDANGNALKTRRDPKLQLLILNSLG